MQRSGSQKQLSLLSPIVTTVSVMDKPLPSIPVVCDAPDPTITVPSYVPPGMWLPSIESKDRYTSAAGTRKHIYVSCGLNVS